MGFQSGLVALRGPPPRVVRVPSELLPLLSELLPRCGGPRPDELGLPRRWSPGPDTREVRSDPLPWTRRRDPCEPAARPGSPWASGRKPAWRPKEEEEPFAGGNRLVGGWVVRAGVASPRHGGADCLAGGGAGRRASARATRSATLTAPPGPLPLPSPYLPRRPRHPPGRLGGRRPCPWVERPRQWDYRGRVRRIESVFLQIVALRGVEVDGVGPTRLPFGVPSGGILLSPLRPLEVAFRERGRPLRARARWRVCPLLR